MNVDACYQLGYVIKKHGTRGEVSVFLDVDHPEDYSKLESVFVEINQKLVPFFVESIQIREGKAVIKFEDVTSQEDASQLKSKSLYLPLSTLPDLEEDQFYYHQVVDYMVIDKHHGEIGVVNSIISTDGQDLLVVNHKGKEVLIPITDDIIGRVDHSEKHILVNVPNGLLEVYLD